MFKKIEKYDNTIKDFTRKIVNESSGKIFVIVKKDTIKGIYLFEVESKNDIKNLKHIKTQTFKNKSSSFLSIWYPFVEVYQPLNINL